MGLLKLMGCPKGEDQGSPLKAGGGGTASRVDFRGAELTGAGDGHPQPCLWDRRLSPRRAWDGLRSELEGQEPSPHQSPRLPLPFTPRDCSLPCPFPAWPPGMFAQSQPPSPVWALLGLGQGHSGAWDLSYFAWSRQSSCDSTCKCLSLSLVMLGPAPWLVSTATSIAPHHPGHAGGRGPRGPGGKND